MPVLLGIDIGGTNTDVAWIDDGITTEKVPNERGLNAALEAAGRAGRSAVSTSQPLNRIIAGAPGSVDVITVPGPGLVYPGSVAGAVNTRGEIIEPLDHAEVDAHLSSHRADYLAVAGKFSVRNPDLEEEIRRLAGRYYDPRRIAVSHPIGELNFPARIATTAVNAMILETVWEIEHTVRAHADDFLFFKGDGGLAPPSVVLHNPSLLFHSSAAAVAQGAFYLTRKKDCLVIDIGGTTTDFVVLRGGRPAIENATIGGERTLIRGVRSASIPFGGDSIVSGHLIPMRMGNALSFGGTRPTLTDALNVTGSEIGEWRRSQSLPREQAEEVVDSYISAVVGTIGERRHDTIIGTGFLAPHLIPLIAAKTSTPFIVPEQAQCANAVGVAVSRISLTLHARFDTGRRRVILNGQPHALDGNPNMDDMIEHCSTELRSLARAAGAPPEDVRDVEVVYARAYDVVRGGRRMEAIADLVLQIAPGITAEAP